MRVCVCVLFLAGSGGPVFRAPSGAPHLSFGCLLICSAPSGLGLPLSCPSVCLFLFLCWCFFFLPPFTPPLSPAFCDIEPLVSCALALCGPFPHPLPLFFFHSFLCAPAVSCFLWFRARGFRDLGAVWPLPLPSPPPVSLFFHSSLCAPAVSCFLCFPASRLLGLGAVWPFSRPPPPGFFLLLALFVRLLSLTFCGFWPWVSWPLMLCGRFPRPPLLVFFLAFAAARLVCCLFPPSQCPRSGA